MDAGDTLMPSGRVQFIGSDQTAAGGFGTVAANLFDGDFTTSWAYGAANGGEIAVDLGAAAVVTRIRLAPSIAGGEDDPGDKTPYGATLRSSTSGWPSYTSDALVHTIGAMSAVFYPARSLTGIEIAPSTARRYWRLVGANGTYGPQLAEFRWDGPYTVGVTSKPVPPTISPWGGRFGGRSTTVTLACETTSASIYYTTDGSTPDNTKTLYTGPFALTPGASGTTIKAIAIDTGLSTTDSDIVTASFYPWSFKVDDDIRDNNGVLVEAHGGNILDNRNRDGFWYWYGAFTNRSNVGVEVRPNVGVWCYKSTDLVNWTIVGYILPNVAGFTHVERPRAVYNSNNGTYVIFGHLKNGPGDSRLGIATATSPTGPWSWVKTDLNINGVGSRDFNVWLEAEGDCWVVYTNEANTSCRIARMNAAFTDLHATPQHTTIIGADREAPIMLKIGTRRFLITSDANAYDYTSTFDVKYLVQNGEGPATGWPSIPDMTAFDAVARTLFAADPVNTAYNGQPTHVIRYGDGMIFMGDKWDPVTLYNSRYVFLPLVQPTNSTLRALVPTSFNLDELTPARPATPRGRALPGRRTLRGRSLSRL